MGRFKRKKKHNRGERRPAKSVSELNQEVNDLTEVVIARAEKLRDDHSQSLQRLLGSAEKLEYGAMNFEKTTRSVKYKQKLASKCCGIFSCCPNNFFYILACGCCIKGTEKGRRKNTNPEIKKTEYVHSRKHASWKKIEKGILIL